MGFYVVWFGWLILWCAAEVKDITSAVSDMAQQNTIAFSGMGFITGTLEADSFLPPGKVADYWGFQSLRDNDPSGLGHNTDFLTKVAFNVLNLLDVSALDQLKEVAAKQIDSVNALGYQRFELMKAFRRNLEGDVPAGSAGLNLTAVAEYSSALYTLDAEISLQRAVVMGNIIHNLTHNQTDFLDNQMVGRGSLEWPPTTQPSYLQNLRSQDLMVGMMTMGGDIFSWYAGSVATDVYFCPERHGTYFGSFYLKDAPAVGNSNYTIDSQLTANGGTNFLHQLSPPQHKIMTGLVEEQRACLMEIVELRHNISTALRAAMVGQPVDAAAVRQWAQRYGHCDGTISYLYASRFATVAQSLNATQQATVASMRTAILHELSVPQTAFLYAQPIPLPTINNTDFLFLLPGAASVESPKPSAAPSQSPKLEVNPQPPARSPPPPQPTPGPQPSVKPIPPPVASPKPSPKASPSARPSSPSPQPSPRPSVSPRPSPKASPSPQPSPKPRPAPKPKTPSRAGLKYMADAETIATWGYAIGHLDQVVGLPLETRQTLAQTMNHTAVGDYAEGLHAHVVTAETTPFEVSLSDGSVKISSWGAAVEKAVVTSFISTEAVLSTLNLPPPPSDSVYAALVLVDRMAADGTLMNDLPLELTVEWTWPTFPAVTLHNASFPMGVELVAAGGTISYTSEPTLLTIRTPHTSLIAIRLVGDESSESPSPASKAGDNSLVLLALLAVGLVALLCGGLIFLYLVRRRCHSREAADIEQPDPYVRDVAPDVALDGSPAWPMNRESSAPCFPTTPAVTPALGMADDAKFGDAC